MRIRHLLVAIALVAAGIPGCEGNGVQPEPGTEGGPCFPNNTCFAGLECQSDVCVNPSAGSDIPWDGEGVGPGNDAWDNGGSETICVPDCENRECGGDGCGGDCGSCTGGSCEGLLWTSPTTCQEGRCSVGGEQQSCDTGLECTIDSCQATSGCESETREDWCLVDGLCVPDNQPHPINVCLYCDSSADAAAWTPVEDATPCGTDSFCIFGDCVGQKCPDNCPPMVRIGAGPFWMGANVGNDQCPGNEPAWINAPTELPCHEVTVPEFEIDKHLVTVLLYGSCVDAEGCSEPDTASRPNCNWAVLGRDLHPVTCITWYQAREFCAWAGKRLCAEAEWEKASRGMDGRIFPWGAEAPSCEYAVMNSDDAGGQGCGAGSTSQIGSRPKGASPYGLLDMSGNVWELLEDDWHLTYEGAPADGSPWVDDERPEDRVVRGGSWLYAGYLHSSARTFYADWKSDLQHGVRCCR